MGFPPASEETFWRRVDKQPGDGCWLWTGATNGRYGLYGRFGYVHRWSYERHTGSIPDGMVINHLCITPLCVRPDHLEVATPRENTRYGTGPAAQRARQTHCKHGHEFTPENTYVKPNGTRACKTCVRDGMRRQRRLLPRDAAAGLRDIPHGTTTGYGNYLCRCDACRRAQSEDRQRRAGGG